MKYSLFSLFCSTFITFLIVRFSHLHSHLSADHDLFGVQKFHAAPVPRIGGVGIFLSLVLSTLLLWLSNAAHAQVFVSFLIPSSLVFGVGLAEDLTKRVSVSVRLIVTMFAALIGSLILDATVRTFGIPILDTLFQINVIALVFTVVAVAGVANAINLIDGFNGLSGFVSVTALLALGTVAYMAGDGLIFTLALISAGGVGGFLLWNYPNAKIFLGDGGAYLVGFVIAELSVLLHERNPQVSILCPLLIVIYPVFETLFSIYRRKFIRGQSPGAPDAMHLHQLVNKRVVRWRVKDQNNSIRSRGNSLTSPYLWLLNLLATAPAVLFWEKSSTLLVFIVIFIATYVWLYRSLTRFQTPKWLCLNRKKSELNRVIAITSNTAWNVFNFRGNLIKTLRKEGYKVVVFAPRDEFAPHLIEMGCEFSEITMENAGTNPLKDVSLIFGYRKLLKKYRPMVLLTFTSKPNIYGSIAARLAGTPVIANISGLGRAFINPSWITVVVHQLYRLSLKHPKKVFFQNSDDKSIFEQLGYVTPIQAGLLPGSGIDTSSYLPPLSPPSANPFVFLLVARMLRDKGVGEFVEAAKKLRKTYPETRFRLVGFLDVDNPSAISRAEMNEWVSSGDIEYLGSTDDVKAHFANANCVVLPSYREGTPRTLLEAASMACPIITTDAPGCRDTIVDGVSGYFCKVRDVDSLVESMQKMIELPDQVRQQMGVSGRRKMEHEFNEQIVFRSYLDSIEMISPAANQDAAISFSSNQADGFI